MATLNPDFRGADDVIVPPDHLDRMGWTDGRTEERFAIAREARGLDRLEEDMPIAFGHSSSAPRVKLMDRKWVEFQKSKGRYEGSDDWTLLDEFAVGKPLLWKPQIIGSCVISNTLRPYVTRMMYQIIMLGMGQEYLGRNEFGPDNFSFYGPWTYGMARRRANMRSGDGLYFEPMAASLLKDGVLPCNTPALVSFLQSKGLADPTDFPEPQGSNGARLYREFGQHRYLDEFKQYATAPVEEINRIRNGDELWEALGEGKTAFCCSMEAIHKVGTHKDGFAIHARNRRDRWAHNMSFQGRMVASDGDRFIRHCNQSWGENHLYNRRLEELDWELRNGGLTCGTIGPIRSPISKAPSV